MEERFGMKKKNINEKLKKSSNESSDESVISSAEDITEEKLKEKPEANDEEKLEDEEFEEIKEEIKDSDSVPSSETIINELKDSENKLKNENGKLQNEVDTLKDRLLRLTAEYDNYRKRTAKEKEGIYTDACEDVLKNIFPVIDNLERASAAEGSTEDLKKGIDMTIRQFDTAMEKLGVEEIPSDSGFDPNYHDAVMHIEDEQYEKNQVVEVFQKGYKRGDKVLRHSMVKVAN